VASFRSTLSEIRDADLVLHVLDASSPRADEEERIALETFEELGVPSERILPVWTKADLTGNGGRPAGLRVSGTTGAGVPALIARIREHLLPAYEEFRVRIPYTSPRAIAEARAAFRVLDEEDRETALDAPGGERGTCAHCLRFVEA
jgi:GTP-binding protein HflX